MANLLRLIDLAFAMDCTGSMGSYIKQAQDSIRSIADEIVRQEKADLNLALVEYRDHPPEDATFVTNVLDFTPSSAVMKSRLDACCAAGGGDTPEAVVDAMHALLKLSWRLEATKVCILISDAPPHGIGCSGDHFPNGCPTGLDPTVVIRQIVEKGVTMYIVGCEPSITPYRDWFMAMAYITGGQYVPLSSASLLSKVIVSGTQEEISLQSLLNEATDEVMKLNSAAAASVDQAKLEEIIFQKLKNCGVKTKHMKAVGGELPSFTAKAIEISEKRSLDEVRAIFIPGSSSSASYARPAAGVGAGISDVYSEEREISRIQAARITERLLNVTGMKAKCSSRSAKTEFIFIYLFKTSNTDISIE